NRVRQWSSWWSLRGVLRIAWATPHPRPLSHNGRGETDGVRNTLRVRLVERVDHLAGHGGGDDRAFAAILDHGDGGQPGAVDRAEGCEPGVRGTPLLAVLGGTGLCRHRVRLALEGAVGRAGGRGDHVHERGAD